MKEKPKQAFIPPAMHDTTRQEIIAALLECPCSAREVSAAVKIPEREAIIKSDPIRALSIPNFAFVKIPHRDTRKGVDSRSGDR